MTLLFLRIMILLISCAIVFLAGNWVADKPVVPKKGITPQVTIQVTPQEECKDTGICPVPKEYLEKMRKKGGDK